MSSNGRATPERNPDQTAGEFLEAVRQQDGPRLWELFSTGARRYIVEKGLRRGLSPAIGEDLIAGTAAPQEQADFLAQLISGLEHDLRDIRLGLVETGSVSIVGNSGQVVLLEAFEIEAGPPLDPLPVGSLLMTAERGEWRIERLVVRPGG